MHELSVAEEIAGIVEKAVGPNTAVETVHITLGPLSGISGDSLEFCFSEVAGARGMGAPKLEVCQKRPALQCIDCGADYEIERFPGEGCPACGSTNGRLIEAHEFTVDWVRLPEHNRER